MTDPIPGVRRRDMHAAVESDGATVSEKELVRWRALFDPKRTSTVDFLQVFDIRTDQPTAGQTETGVHYCRFVLKPKQRELIEESEKRWKRGRAARWRIPKCRGYGLSSIGSAWLGFERVLRVPGWEYTLIAQDQEAAEEHLDRLADFFAQVPKAVLTALGIERVKGTRRSFIFLHAGRKKSRVTVKTARKRGLGRGGTNNAVHMTERPHWPDKSKEDLSGILGRCYDVPGNVILDESTAMGYDEFYDDCMDAEAGRGGGYRLFFIPAQAKEINYTPVEDPAAFVETIGTDKRYGAEEEHLVRDRVRKYWRYERHMEESVADAKALEFLLWRRGRIDGDLKHVRVMHREEPTYLAEAFQGYGRLVFPADVMETHKPLTDERERMSRTGMLRLAADGLSFVDVTGATLRVWEFPVAGESYCFGADPASGQRVQSGKKGEEADFCVMTVKHALSGRTVAMLRGHIYPKQFSSEILRLAAWFNGAMGLVENNLPTVVSHLLNDDEEVCGISGADILLTTEKIMKTDSSPEKIRDYGWKTTSKSKPHLSSCVVDFMLETGVATPATKATPWDAVTMSECLRFVYDERGGMSAEDGHDDCVIAEGLALLSRREVMEEVNHTRVRRPPYVAPGLQPFYNMVAAGRSGPPEHWVLTRTEDGKAKYVKVTEKRKEAL